jgi:hypothetical protein
MKHEMMVRRLLCGRSTGPAARLGAILPQIGGGAEETAPHKASEKVGDLSEHKKTEHHHGRVEGRRAGIEIETKERHFAPLRDENDKN